MKKEVILILIILLFSTAVYATCDVLATIDKGVSKIYTAKGKDYTIKFSSLKNESGDILATFEVNSVSTPYLEKTQKYSFNDLSEITIQDITLGSGSVNDSAQICFNAGLKGYGKDTCTSSKECDDNNPCTIDECDGDPLRCRHKLILWCRHNDGCCPESRCTVKKDNDCQQKHLTGCINDSNCSNSNNLTNNLTGCISDSDCNDNNISTMDICGLTTKKCTHIRIAECISGDNTCPENCRFISDTDCDECSINDECEDSNACTSDTCSGSPKRCSNTATPGCDANGVCLAVGTKKEDKFCDKDNIMKSLRSKKEYCDNNYECLSNYCVNNKCKNLSFFKKIIDWLVFRII